jgi:hypothetical protein
VSSLILLSLVPYNIDTWHRKNVTGMYLAGSVGACTDLRLTRRSRLWPTSPSLSSRLSVREYGGIEYGVGYR